MRKSLRETPGYREKGRGIMATYISLIRWTQKGIQNLKESPARLDEAKRAFEAAGAKVLGFYLVMGHYDMILISEGPDDETASRLALAIGSGGHVRTETFRAFPEDEYRKIVTSVS
jgi:uncharacterized protein with GYD domain